MAKKKKTNPEDEWFEDDFEDEPKPKKKSKKKKKKTGKAVAWVIAFIVILAILLFIRFKYTAPAEQDTSDDTTAPEPEVIEKVVTEPEEERYEDTGTTYEEPKYIGPDVVEKEDLPKVQEVVDTTADPELFSNVKCDYDYTAELLYISLRIYNTLDEDMKISPRGVQKGYNTYFKIRGLVDMDPGCKTELLQPGEYTECTKIGFDNLRYGNVEGTNRISVQVPSSTEALIVDCPAMPSSSSDEE